MNNYKLFNFRLEESVYEKIRQYAVTKTAEIGRAVSMSEIVRGIIKEHILAHYGLDVDIDKKKG